MMNNLMGLLNRYSNNTNKPIEIPGRLTLPTLPESDINTSRSPLQQVIDKILDEKIPPALLGVVSSIWSDMAEFVKIKEDPYLLHEKLYEVVSQLDMVLEADYIAGYGKSGKRGIDTSESQ